MRSTLSDFNLSKLFKYQILQIPTAPVTPIAENDNNLHNAVPAVGKASSYK